jgi:hypothetical protein
MASINIAGDTSGTLTLSAPLVAGSNTVTLPAATGTISLLTQGTAVASTSGTSIDFTGIPSWAKRITVMFQGVSTSGTSAWLVQIGAGSVTTSGYLGASADGPTLGGTNYTAGFGLRVNTASAVIHGALTITNISSNAWVASGNLARSDSGVFVSSSGSISLGGTLDRVRITTVNGTDTFDAGSINIMYEG